MSGDQGAPAPRGPQDVSVPEVYRRFEYHRPSGVAQDMHQALRAEAMNFALGVLFGLPASREKSLAYTAFEEATFWAHAAIARDPSLHAEEGADGEG